MPKKGPSGVKKNNTNDKKTSPDENWLINKELAPSVVDCPKSIFQKFVRFRFQQDLYTIPMDQDITVTTDTSGVIQTVIGNLPSTASNWSTFAAAFDEYRVLAFQVKFSAYDFNGGPTTVIRAPIVVVTDYDSSTAFTTYTTASQYSSVKEYAGGVSWTYSAFMSGVENSGFISTSAPVANFWVKTWSAGNINSTSIGRFKTRYIVQFRGKGI